jgi:beta-glucosidase
MSFRKDFQWGCATSAYQIEGGWNADGKGLSVWDMMCRKEKAIWRGQTGDAACDHYRRWKEDVALMKELGLKAYRFSLSWPRLLPAGVGKINNKGADFYRRLCDALCDAGIEPFVTLFHWDFPYELYKRGGWLNRDSAAWFGDYAATAAKALGGRVTRWMTHNEPQCTIGLGHKEGTHAPGDKLGLKEWLLCAHHLLLSHGKAVQALRAVAKQDWKIGYAPIGHGFVPATNSRADILAARQKTYSVNGPNVWNSTWWIDPVILGRYPEDGLKLFGKAAPQCSDADLKTMAQPLDFLGLNIYHAQLVRSGAGGKAEVVAPPDGEPLTTFYWPVVPQALYWVPKFLQERYKLPLYITENGMACCDWVALDGKVHDPQRIDFLHRYLRELRRAAAAGVDLRGYFQWSFMDNFEWAEGCKQRFGLIHVDYATQKRTPKDSYYWYRKVIRGNGTAL